MTVVNWYALLGSSLLYIVGLPVCKRSQTFAFFLWLFVEVVTCASSVLTCVEEYPLVVCLSVCCLHSFLFDSSSYKAFCRFLNANTLSSWYLLCGKKGYSLLYCMAMWALHPRISVTRLASVTYSLLAMLVFLLSLTFCRLSGCFACNFCCVRYLLNRLASVIALCCLYFVYILQWTLAYSYAVILNQLYGFGCIAGGVAP